MATIKYVSGENLAHAFNKQKALINTKADSDFSNVNPEVFSEAVKNAGLHSMASVGSLEMNESGGIQLKNQLIEADGKVCSNPNLLDNWYFGVGVIDQRQGYVVAPGTAYYSDTGLTTQAGTVSEYTAVEYVDGVYGSVTVDGTAYYVAWSAAVRGYAGIGYTIDRWQIPQHDNPPNLTVDGDGITFGGTDTGTLYLRQTMEDHGQLNGREVTVSVLTKDGVLAWAAGRVPETASANTAVAYTDFNEGTARIAFHKTTAGTLVTQFSLLPSESSSRKEAGLKAVKLELGSVQTLAHQDGEGNWVLNDPPPHPQQELAKCQRYFAAYPHTPVSIPQIPLICDANYQVFVPVIGLSTLPMRISAPAVKTLSTAMYAHPADGSAPIDISDAAVTCSGYGSVLTIVSTKLTVGQTYIMNTSSVNKNYCSLGVTLSLDANL